MQKHLDVDHSLIYKRFQEKINNERKENVEIQSTKKRSLISNSSIFDFFASKDPFRKDDVEQKMFVENLTLLIMKNHLFLQFLESVWLKCLMLQLCLCVQFPFRKMIFKHYFA